MNKEVTKQDIEFMLEKIEKELDSLNYDKIQIESEKLQMKKSYMNDGTDIGKKLEGELEKVEKEIAEKENAKNILEELNNYEIEIEKNEKDIKKFEKIKRDCESELLNDNSSFFNTKEENLAKIKFEIREKNNNIKDLKKLKNYKIQELGEKIEIKEITDTPRKTNKPKEQEDPNKPKEQEDPNKPKEQEDPNKPKEISAEDPMPKGFGNNPIVSVRDLEDPNKAKEISAKDPIPKGFGNNPIVPVRDLEDPNKPKEISAKDPIPKGFGDNPIVPVTEKLPVVDSGLQVLADIFRDEEMPEIKGKHVLSSNPAMHVLEYGPVIAAVVALGGLPAIAVAAGGAIAGNLIKNKALPAITGRNRITEEIAEVIRKQPIERLKLLAEYLTEEQILDIMPNEVFLDALQGVLENKYQEMEKGTSKEILESQEKKNDLNEEIEKIENKLNSKSLNELEIQELKKQLNTKSAELGKVMQEDEEKKVDVNIAARQVKEVKRGKERKGHGFRGNVKGVIDGLFTRKNAPTKDYLPVLDEYASKEKEVLIAKKQGDKIKEYRAKEELDEIFNENADKKETRKAVFNSREGVARIISDRVDNRIKNAFKIVTIGSATIKTVMNLMDLQKNQDTIDGIIKESTKDTTGKEIDGTTIDNNTLKGALNKEVIDRATLDETAAMRAAGGNMTGDTYNAMDQAGQVNTEGAVNKINNISSKGDTKIVDALKQIIEMKKDGLSSEEILGESTNSELIHSYKIDHSEIAGVLQNNSGSAAGKAEIEILEKVTKTLETIQNSNFAGKFGKVAANFAAPIIAFGTSIFSDRSKKDKDINIEKDTEDGR